MSDEEGEGGAAAGKLGAMAARASMRGSAFDEDAGARATRATGPEAGACCVASARRCAALPASRGVALR